VNGPVRLRRADAADAPRIAAIHRESRAAAMPWLAVVHTPEEDLDFFARQVLPRARVWVADVEGRVAGFVALEGNRIEHLYIDPEYWRQGVGHLLLSRCLEQDGPLELWTFQRNERARRFYEAHGFVAAQITDGSANEEREPDVLYVLDRHGTGRGAP
jgi:putative acetyltransferase